MTERLGSGTDGTAKIEPAKVRFGIEFEGDGDELAAHGVAGDERLAGSAVFPHEISAQRFGLGVSLLQRPSSLRISALDDGVVALEEGLLLAG